MATSEKYDRQLRLWGSHGQKALMDSHVVLLGSSAVGAETLKNLVLPGIGKFTVCDDATVTEADLGNNFFVTGADLGTGRAHVVCKHLCEMNDDVHGEAVGVSVASLVGTQCEQLLALAPTLLIIANQPSAITLQLSQLCAQQSPPTPLIVVRSYGFLGYMRLQLRDHDIIEGKPDPSNGVIHDTRIYNSFLALESFCASISLDDLEPYEHKHVPYIVILVQVLQTWRTQHNGNSPTRKDREELTALVSALSNNYSPPHLDEDSRKEFEQFKGIHYEDNFKEALKNISKLWAPKNVRPELVTMLEAEHAAATATATATANDTANNGKSNNMSNSDSSSSGHSNDYQLTHFSALLLALRAFMANNGGNVPHSGEIPDMVSTTSYFIALQRVYEAKALEDKEQIRSLANAKCKLAGIGPVSDEMLNLFCKNVYDITRCNHRTLLQEATECNMEEVQSALWDPAEQPEQTPIVWYFVLHAADAFYNETGRYPGVDQGDTAEDLSADVARVWQLIKNRVAEVGLTAGLIDENFLSEKHAVELVRYGAVEMHNVSAIVAGIGSQEAVKVITKQYVPIDNTYIYNGIACNGGKYTL